MVFIGESVCHVFAGGIGILREYNTLNNLLLIGVLPEYRAKGANAILFDDLIRWYKKYGFTKALTLAMMETNDGVLSAWQYFEASTVKRLRSYKRSI